jgi:hypothetical protein
MGILSNHYPEVLDELNGIETDRPESPEPTEAEINAMAEQAKRHKRPRPARRVGLLLAIHDGNSGIIRLEVGDASADYYVTRIGSDWGDGFLLEKIGHEAVYHVHLSAQGHQCECKGFLRWNHCKHTSCLATLRDRGLI